MTRKPPTETDLRKDREIYMARGKRKKENAPAGRSTRQPPGSMGVFFDFIVFLAFIAVILIAVLGR